ncbi:hypothetical protein [Piscinibacter koreensis]|nr:hypothetical protein [Schlegelella koreensis]
MNTGDVAAQLAMGGIPLTLLVDTAGREVARKLAPVRWTAATCRS